MRPLLFIPGFFLLFLAAPAATAQGWPRSWTFDAADIPVEFTADLKEPGMVWVEQVSAPQNFVLDLLNGSGPHPHPTTEFRVGAGAFTLRVNPRPNLLVRGPIELRIHYQVETDPTEPANDAPRKARKISLDEPVPLTLFPMGEADFLEVNVPRPGYLFVDAPGAPEKFVLHAEITSATGEILGVNSAQVYQKGPFTVRISDQKGAFSSTKPLNLHFRFVDELDAAEPNRSPADAILLQTGEVRRVFLLPSGDADYFRLNVPGNGRLLFRAPDAPFTLQWNRVEPQTGRVLATGTELEVAKGLCVVELKALDPLASSLKPFHFQILWLPEWQSPAPRRVAGRRYSSLLEAGGGSTWKIDVSKPSIVWFHARPASPGPKADFSVAGKRERSNPIWVRAPSGSAEASLLRTDEGRDPASFQVWMDLEPEMDQSEPNDTLSRAGSLPLETPTPIVLHPADDMDWFSVRQRRTSSLQLEIQSPSGRLDAFADGFDLGITDKNGSPVAQRIGRSEDGIVWRPMAVELKRGDYFVWIRGRSGGHSPEPLNLLAYPAGEILPSTGAPQVQLHVLHPPEDAEEAVRLYQSLTASGAHWLGVVPPSAPMANAERPSAATAPANTKRVPLKTSFRWWWTLGLIPVAVALLFLLRLLRAPHSRRVIDLTR